MIELFERLFRTEEREPHHADDLLIARSVVDFASHDGFKRLLAWLDSESSMPLPVSAPSGELVAAATRSNVLRQIRAKLLSDTARAERLIAEARRTENE